MMGNIFNKYYLHEFIDNFRKNLVAEIDKLEITETSNILNLVETLKAKYRIEPLELKEAIPSEPKETTRKIRNHWGDIYEEKVFEINVRIPFDGNSDLFYCHPSRSTIIYLDKSVQIGRTNISMTVILDDLDPTKYQAHINRLVGDLSSNIPIVNSEIAPWNNELEVYIKNQIELRKGVVSKKFDFMEKIGLKVNQKSTDFMIPNPVAKKTIPVPISDTTVKIGKEFVPILQDLVYTDIKEVLYNVGKAIERKPSIYLGKHEEDLRDIFLLFLETRYEATSGVGEAFNKKGKTDILLKYAKDGSNIFVAECKVWKGQKKLFEGIDQLLGYLTHRDSKTALMIFVDQKELSTVISTIKEELKKHLNFRKHLKDNYDTSFSYEFTLPDDKQKVIQIEIMVYHFPKV
jgi:hypothetical protein